MYNIFKGQVVPTDDDATQIINSNERINQIFEEQRERFEKRAEEYRQKCIEDYLMTLEADEDGKPIIPTDDEGNFVLPHDLEGNQLLYVTSDGYLSEEEEVIEEAPEEPESEEEVAQPVEPELPPVDREAILAEVTAEADAIKKQAQADAEAITTQAQSEADALKAQASEAGRTEGFAAGHDEGMAKADEEIRTQIAAQQEQLNAQLAEERAALETERAALNAQISEERAALEAEKQDMEKQMADVFCDIIDKVIGIEFSGKKEIVLHLVDHVITNTPTSKEYLIRINDANYDMVSEHRQDLIDKIGEGVELEIVKDPLLGLDECQIETDGGVYDCGMDTQLANLLKDLRALSLV